MARERDDNIRATLRALIQEIRGIHMEIDALRETQLQTQRIRDFRSHHGRRETAFENPVENARHQRGRGILTLKEARNMIPEIDDTLRDRVREFLNASTYTMKSIHFADEYNLLEAILCTKFKGKAMMDFYTRDIENFEQLKRELEKEYLGKCSTAHLQLEFNSLKQKSNETAQEFGRRVDNLAMELYESM